MSDEVYELNMGNLNDGKVLEAVDDAIRRVMQSIKDPNTDPEQKRQITVKINFKPNYKRDYADVVANVETKTPGLSPSVGSVHISTIAGVPKGFVRNIAQEALSFGEPQTGSKQ